MLELTTSDVLGSTLRYWNFSLARFSSLIYAVISIVRKSIKLSIHFSKLNVSMNCHFVIWTLYRMERRNMYQIQFKAPLLKITFLFIFFYIKRLGHFFAAHILVFILRRLFSLFLSVLPQFFISLYQISAFTLIHFQFHFKQKKWNEKMMPLLAEKESQSTKKQKNKNIFLLYFISDEQNYFYDNL